MSTLEATSLSDGVNESLRNNLHVAVRARDRAKAEVVTAEDEADQAGRHAVRTARSARDLVSGLESRLNFHMRDEINVIFEELGNFSVSAKNVLVGDKRGRGEVVWYMFLHVVVGVLSKS